MTQAPLAETPAALPFVAPDDFRGAMREMIGGVTIVAGGRGSTARGLTATAVVSMTADPPTVLVCINRQGEGHGAIRSSGVFSVNVVPADGVGIADRFAGRDHVHGAARFEAEAWTTHSTGAPVLIGAVAVFDCEVLQAIDVFTHTVFIGAVRGVAVAPPRPALAYRAGAYVAVA
ncbi:flavin reductase [Siculibacillus lacustris]|uniref:Flavin reductase n=1 Tax=Siculibacillus lacustris TaxID=1549641 RepID=A0A4Q9VJJ1_9HYPH|nr:flavin reductase family protein [Siculibacillus lacustris]TBW35490.1 flavin reductase [Siculibacillus lacustris]